MSRSQDNTLLRRAALALVLLAVRIVALPAFIECRSMIYLQQRAPAQHRPSAEQRKEIIYNVIVSHKVLVSSMGR